MDFIWEHHWNIIDDISASAWDGGPCCPCQSRNSTCSRCVCVRSGRKCTSCRALYHGTCKNGSRDPVIEIADPDANTEDPSPTCVESAKSDSVTSNDFINAKLTQAFGASILWSDGGSLDDPWGTWWICACRMSGSQYDIPGGAVGREFVDLLTNEVWLLIDNSAASDCLIIFCPVMLQRNHMVRVGSDVRHLLKRHIEMWKSNSFEALLCEAEHCAAQCRNRQPRLSDDHVVRVFTHLMFRGRVHEAVRFVTDRARGGVLKPSDTDAKSGKCVLDVLREKHPPPGMTSQDAFVSTFAC